MRIAEHTTTEPHVTLSQMSLPPHISLLFTPHAIAAEAEKAGATKVQILPSRQISLRVLGTNNLGSLPIPVDFHWPWTIDTQLEIAEGREPRPSDLFLRKVIFPSEPTTNTVMHKLMESYPHAAITVHSLGDNNTLGHLADHPFQLELVPQNGIMLPDLQAKMHALPKTLTLAFPSRETDSAGLADQFELWKTKNIFPHDKRRIYTWEEMFHELQTHITAIHVGPLPRAELVHAYTENLDLSVLTPTEEKIKWAYQQGFRGDLVVEIDPTKILQLTGAIQEGEGTIQTVLKGIKYQDKTRKYLQAVNNRLRKIRDQNAKT